MDITLALTLLGIVIANIGTTITLFLWSTSNANEFRKEAAASREETNALIKSIADEMKDFHGRLCAIEERSRVKIQ